MAEIYSFKLDHITDKIVSILQFIIIASFITTARHFLVIFGKLAKPFLLFHFLAHRTLRVEIMNAASDLQSFFQPQLLSITLPRISEKRIIIESLVLTTIKSYHDRYVPFSTTACKCLDPQLQSNQDV